LEEEVAIPLGVEVYFRQQQLVEHQLVEHQLVEHQWGVQLGR
jgi:hypothetical protein